MRISPPRSPPLITSPIKEKPHSFDFLVGLLQKPHVLSKLFDVCKSTYGEGLNQRFVWNGVDGGGDVVVA